MSVVSSPAIRKSPLSSPKAMYLLFLCILVPTGIGFITKLIELFRVFVMSADGAFALMPIVNYLLATMGFVLLLFWAASNGMFREVENPKFDLFKQEAMLDRCEDEMDVAQQTSKNDAGVPS